MSLGQKKKGNLPGGSKLKPKIKGIRAADTQSQTGEAKDRCENTLSTGNPSPILSQSPKDPWSLDSPAHHKNSLESCGIQGNEPIWADRPGSRLSEPETLHCDSFQRVNMYSAGNYPAPYGQYWPTPARFGFQQPQAGYHHARETYYEHTPEQTPYQSSARTGGVIGQRFRGFSEHETLASGPTPQWIVSGGRQQSGAFHHQGYSSYGWPQVASEQEDLYLANPRCTPAAGTQRKAGPVKPSSSYRMF